MNRISDGRDAGAFITSDLDDFGLDPYAFRIYGRIARRAGTRNGCFESIDNIAEACRIDRKRVYDAIKVLLKHRLIEKEPKQGKPSSYYLTPREQWIPLTYTENGTGVYRKRDTTYTENGTPPIPKTEHKGIKEGNPKKGIPSTSADDAKKPVDPFFTGQYRAIAREVVKQQRSSAAPRNFLEDGPWAELATETGRTNAMVFRHFKTYLEEIANVQGKRDPEAYAGAIANSLFNNPGSELACKPWIKFADHYRVHLCVPDVSPLEDSALGQNYRRFKNALNQFED